MNGLIGAVKLVGSLCTGYAAEEAVVNMASNYYSSTLSKGAIRIGGFVIGCMAEEAADGYLDRATTKAAKCIINTEKSIKEISNKKGA
jgi:hypothetical protein